MGGGQAGIQLRTIESCDSRALACAMAKRCHSGSVGGGQVEPMMAAAADSSGPSLTTPHSTRAVTTVCISKLCHSYCTLQLSYISS